MIKRDSFFVQAKSLESFMMRLGYHPATTRKGLVFVGSFKELSSRKVISFSNAVSMHNKSATASFVNDTFVNINGFEIPTYLFRQAEAAKIVDRVSLHLHGGEIMTNKVWVRFVNNTGELFQRALGAEIPDVAVPEMFLSDLYTE